MDHSDSVDAAPSPISLRSELIGRGYNDRAIARLVSQGELARARRGAYVDGPTWRALDSPERHALTARAALRQGRTEAVLSHVSALPEYDAPMWNMPLETVHITRKDGKSGRKERGIQQHSGQLLPEDVVARNGVLVTSPTRTALDVTTMFDVEAGLVVVNHFLHEELTTPEALATRYALMDHWPNTLRTDLVLRLADGRLESVLETRFLYLCWRQALPQPVPQYEVRDAFGRVVARLDFAWPELGVYVECDGKVKYIKPLREGESAADVVVREKRREDTVRELTGMRGLRVVWDDLYTPDQTGERVRGLLFPAQKAA
jgi:hypothetical protein